MGIALNDEGRAHFTATADMQNLKPQSSLQKMSRTAAETQLPVPEKWMDHPEVKKLGKWPAEPAPGTKATRF